MREPEPSTVERARTGDTAAFEDLVRMYLPDAYRLACHLLRDPHAAEDVTQDAFLNAYRALPRFRGDAKFSTWLFRIVHNCAVETQRSAERRRRLTLSQEPPTVTTDPGLRVALRNAIDALPADLRHAFVVIEVFGFTYPEASGVLRVPVGTLKSRMHRARRELMASLAEEDTGEM